MGAALIVGAAVSVAVAVGGFLATAEMGSWSGAQPAERWPIVVPADWSVPCYWYRHLSWIATHDTFDSRDTVAHGNELAVVEPACSLETCRIGCPFRCMGMWFSVDRRANEGATSVLHGAIEVPRGLRRNLWWPWLPVQPLLPGLVSNTVVYAMLLWVPIRGFLLVRRQLRWRRNLCLACAYPIGSSPVCTECGTPVTPHQTSATAANHTPSGS